jgi:hypothetical protein
MEKHSHMCAIIFILVMVFLALIPRYICVGIDCVSFRFIPSLYGILDVIYGFLTRVWQRHGSAK